MRLVGLMLMCGMVDEILSTDRERIERIVNSLVRKLYTNGAHR